MSCYNLSLTVCVSRIYYLFAQIYFSFFFIGHAAVLNLEAGDSTIVSAISDDIFSFEILFTIAVYESGVFKSFYVLMTIDEYINITIC
jgi:hypothetical protein